MNSSKSQGISIRSLHRLPKEDAALVLEVKIISCSGEPAPDPSTTTSASELFADVAPGGAFGLTAEVFPVFVVAIVVGTVTASVVLDTSRNLLDPIRKESRVQG